MITIIEEMESSEVTRIGCKIPESFRDLMKERKNEQIVIAGGFMRDTWKGIVPRDIDVFCSDKAYDISKEYYVLRKHEAVSWKEQLHSFIVQEEGQACVQFIFARKFDTPENLIRQFDFTSVQAATYFEGDWKGICSNHFRDDVTNLVLRYTQRKIDKEFAGESFFRMQKFLKRGWKISKEDTAAILARLFVLAQDVCSTTDFKDESQVAEMIEAAFDETDGES